ncbi:hypothetical protein C8R43DRAFT_991521 [Mycena crocata]|nr:hypothetical protein C8R43DRAFT_991521 [Mycena crocata]
MSELIFVTGASGFLGSHVVHQLLDKGYRVRACTRQAKAEHLKSTYASYGDHFEIVKITDIAHDQFMEALVGVDAIVHMASPMPGRAEPETLFEAAVNGTLNVVVQGEKAGVKRMVITSSIASVANPTGSYTDQDWNPLTKEFALDSGNDMIIYSAAKTFAERALWEWADKHPHVDVTTLNPPFFFGPFAPGFLTPDFTALSSNTMFYNYLFPDGAFPWPMHHIDVRDVAQAQMRALTAPSTAKVGRKRLIFSSPNGWPLQRTLDFIAVERPELKERLTHASPPQELFGVMPMDFDRVETVLGMRASDFRTAEETTLDTVDALLQVEAEWRSAGRTITTPPTM